MDSFPPAFRRSFDRQVAAVMAACRALVSRAVLPLHYHHVSRGVMLTQVREKKRWMKAYTLIMERKKKIEGPPPPKPRSVEHLKANGCDSNHIELPAKDVYLGALSVIIFRRLSVMIKNAV